MRGRPGRKHHVISAAAITANYSEEVKRHCMDGCGLVGEDGKGDSSEFV